MVDGNGPHTPVRVRVFEGDIGLRLKGAEAQLEGRTAAPANAVVKRDIRERFRFSWPLGRYIRRDVPGFC